MFLLSEIVVNIGSVARDGLLDSFVGEWSELLDSNDGDVLNKSISYISLAFLTLVFQLIEELATTEENLLDL